jgi:hypothetical protein
MGTNEFIRVKVEGISQLEKMRAFLDPKLFQKATRAGILAAAVIFMGNGLRKPRHSAEYQTGIDNKQAIHRKVDLVVF